MSFTKTSAEGESPVILKV